MTRIENLIGEGSRVRVFVSSEDENRVVKISKEDTEIEPVRETKARFYLTKVFHGLFPLFIPDVHLVSNNGVEYRTVADRVNFDAGYGKLASFYLGLRSKFLAGEDERRFVKLWERHSKMVFGDRRVKRYVREIADLGVDWLDRAPINFGYHRHGQPVYVDSIRPWVQYGESWRGADVEAIRVKIGQMQARLIRSQLSLLTRYRELLTQQLAE